MNDQSRGFSSIFILVVLALVVVIGIAALSLKKDGVSTQVNEPDSASSTQATQGASPSSDKKDFNWKVGDKIGDFTLISLSKSNYTDTQVLATVQAGFTGTATISGEFLVSDRTGLVFAISKADIPKIPLLPFYKPQEICFDNSPDELDRMVPMKSGDKPKMETIQINGFSIGYAEKGEICREVTHLVRVLP